MSLSRRRQLGRSGTRSISEMTSPTPGSADKRTVRPTDSAGDLHIGIEPLHRPKLENHSAKSRRSTVETSLRGILFSGSTMTEDSLLDMIFSVPSPSGL